MGQMSYQAKCLQKPQARALLGYAGYKAILAYHQHPFVALMVSGRHPTGLWGSFAQASQAVIMVSSSRTQALALRGFCLLLRPECPQPFPSLPGEPYQHPNPSHTGALGIVFVSKGSRGTVITPHNFLILPSTFFVMSAPSSLSALLQSHRPAAGAILNLGELWCLP